MKCRHCGKDNRPEAKFCRFCGSAAEQSQNGLIGKENIASQLEEFDKKLKVAKIFASSGTRVGLDCLILGDSGTGKNFIARLLAAKLLASGASKQAAKEVDAADWDEFSKDFDKTIGSLKDGILPL